VRSRAYRTARSRRARRITHPTRCKRGGRGDIGHTGQDAPIWEEKAQSRRPGRQSRLEARRWVAKDGQKSYPLSRFGVHHHCCIGTSMHGEAPGVVDDRQRGKGSSVRRKTMIKLTDQMREEIDPALAHGCPCLVATISKDGVPNVGYKGSVMVFDDESL